MDGNYQKDLYKQLIEVMEKVDRLEYSCYHQTTLCTAYKSTVQTEQAVTNVMEPGHMSGSGIFHPRDGSC